MSNRFTDSEKWDDPWFRKLLPNNKLLYLYLCDRCDLAGFWEIDTEDAAFRTKISEADIKESLDSLGEKFVKNCRYLWLRNFLKRQKNFPLDPFVPSGDGRHGSGNKAHAKIIKILFNHRGLCPEVDALLESVDWYLSSINPPLVGDVSPPGIGIGKGIDQGQGNGKEVHNDTNSEFNLFMAEFKAMNRAVGVVAAKKAWITTTVNGRTGKNVHPPVAPSVILKAAKHYRMLCQQEKREPKHIKQPASFLGPDRHWEDFKDAPKRVAGAKATMGHDRGSEYYEGEK